MFYINTPVRIQQPEVRGGHASCSDTVIHHRPPLNASLTTQSRPLMYSTGTDCSRRLHLGLHLAFFFFTSIHNVFYSCVPPSASLVADIHSRRLPTPSSPGGEPAILCSKQWGGGRDRLVLVERSRHCRAPITQPGGTEMGQSWPLLSLGVRFLSLPVKTSPSATITKWRRNEGGTAG